MWIVAKYKSKELSFLKKNFTESLGDSINFYIPKIKYQKSIRNKIKYFEKYILEGYLFCYHPKFSDKNILQSLSYTRGLSYFLKNSDNNQKEINWFLSHCKKFENKDGYITQGFFDNENIKKAKFLEGPFVNMIFDIISKEKDKIKILIGKIETTINNNKYLYRSI